MVHEIRDTASWKKVIMMSSSSVDPLKAMDRSLFVKLETIRQTLQVNPFQRRGWLHLPIEAGKLYHDYIFEPGKCDVRMSSFKNLSNWLRVLEREGYIVTTVRMHKSPRDGEGEELGNETKLIQVQLNRVATHQERVRAFRRSRGTPVKIIRSINSPRQVTKLNTKTLPLKISHKAKLFDWLEACSDFDLTPKRKPTAMEELLLSRIVRAIEQEDVSLPMEASLFYEKYILDHQRIEVKHSTFQNFRAWLGAMQSHRLVTVETLRTNARKKTKFIVALGSKGVEQYVTKRSTGFDWDALSEATHEPTDNPFADDNTLAKDASSEALGSNGGKASQTEYDGNNQTDSDTLGPQMVDPAAVDGSLLHYIANFTKQDCLPMDSKDFYERFIVSQRYDVKLSSYQTLSRWLEAMEEKGFVKLKSERTGHHYENTMVVVAAGFEAVHRLRRSMRKSIPSNIQNKNDASLTAIDGSISVNADLIDKEAGQIPLKPSRHAKDRQKQRNITNSEIEAALMNGTQVRRERGGIRTYTDAESGVSVVVKRGGRNNILTAHRKESHSSQMERWACECNGRDIPNPSETYHSHDFNMWEIPRKVSTITVVQSYARYQKKPGTKLKWKEGDLIRRKKRLQLNMLILGLDDELLLVAKKNIQNQIGCGCTIGILDYREWYDENGEIHPFADNGSMTLLTQVAAQAKAISSLLAILERIIPTGSRRRYFKESLSHALNGERVLLQALKSSDDPSTKKDKESVDIQGTADDFPVIQCSESFETAAQPATFSLSALTENSSAEQSVDNVVTESKEEDTTMMMDLSSCCGDTTETHASLTDGEEDEKPPTSKVDIFGEAYTVDDTEEEYNDSSCNLS